MKIGIIATIHNKQFETKWHRSKVKCDLFFLCFRATSQSEGFPAKPGLHDFDIPDV